eukprot:UN17742
MPGKLQDMLTGLGFMNVNAELLAYEKDQTTFPYNFLMSMDDR